MIGQPVVIKEGFVPVPATTHCGTNFSKHLSTSHYWFMGVARASRQKSGIINLGLIVPSFSKPDDWPIPTSSALQLVPLEALAKGEHAGCHSLQSHNDKIMLLQGLTASDAQWRLPHTIQSALQRSHTEGLSTSQDTRGKANKDIETTEDKQEDPSPPPKGNAFQWTCIVGAIRDC